MKNQWKNANRKKNTIILLSISMLALCIVLILLYRALLLHTSRFESYDLNYIKSNMASWIDHTINDENDYIAINECHFVIQDNQCYVFYTYTPQKDHPIFQEMITNDVIQRNEFYGYAKIQKKFNRYVVSDSNFSNYDTYQNSNYVSTSGVSRNHNRIYFGTVLDERVDKIEFYDEEILVKTYLVGDKNFYLVNLDSIRGNVTQRYYDASGLLMNKK